MRAADTEVSASPTGDMLRPLGLSFARYELRRGTVPLAEADTLLQRGH
jgi:hypothetical protein